MQSLCKTFVLAFFVSVLPMAATAQPEEPPQEATASAAAVASEETVSEAVAGSEEEVERIEEALDELEDRLDELQESVEDGVEADLADAERALRDRQREMRRARDRMREHLSGVSRDSKISFGSDVHLPEGQVGRDVVAIGGSVYVEGEAHGDAVAIGGSVEVTGQVTGDVIAVGGRVILGPDSEVLGQVTAVGAGVERAEGARVLGGVNEIDLGDGFSFDLMDWDWDGPDRDWIRLGKAMDAVWGLIALLVLVVLSCLILLIGGDTVEGVRRKAIESPWQSGLVGLASQLCFLPVLIIVIVILSISIIGIPLLILVPFAVLGFVVALLVGYAGIGLAVGRWLGQRFGWRFESPFVALLVGVVVIQSFSLAGDFLGVIGSFIAVFAVMFGLFGFFVKFVSWTVGLGAFLIFSMDRRSARRSLAAGGSPSVPAPPPSPETDESTAE